MNPDNKTACVTGATGMIGKRIVERLLAAGYHVRVLTRNGRFDDLRAQVFKGGLCDEKTLRAFVKGGHLIFHCAGEIHDESKMRQINVSGTEKILSAIKKMEFVYFCHISSAGIIGHTEKKNSDRRNRMPPHEPL